MGKWPTSTWKGAQYHLSSGKCQLKPHEVPVHPTRTDVTSQEVSVSEDGRHGTSAAAVERSGRSAEDGEQGQDKSLHPCSQQPEAETARVCQVSRYTAWSTPWDAIWTLKGNVDEHTTEGREPDSGPARTAGGTQAAERRQAHKQQGQGFEGWGGGGVRVSWTRFCADDGKVLGPDGGDGHAAM